jgi:hypothetical protein
VNYDKSISLLSRIFVFAAFVLIAVATIEEIANVSGYTVLRETYRPGRLIELAAALSVIVIALILRQIREDLRKKT